jgi:hypothetical protein
LSSRGSLSPSDLLHSMALRAVAPDTKPDDDFVELAPFRLHRRDLPCGCGGCSGQEPKAPVTRAAQVAVRLLRSLYIAGPTALQPLGAERGPASNSDLECRALRKGGAGLSHSAGVTLQYQAISLWACRRELVTTETPGSASAKRSRSWRSGLSR